MPGRKLPLRPLRHLLEEPAARLLECSAALLGRRTLWLLAGMAAGIAASAPGRSNRILDRHRRNVMRPCGFDVEPREVYHHVIGNLLDFVHFSRSDDGEFMRAVRVHGAGNMASALSLGRGVLAVTAHYGAWELVPRAVRLLGHGVGVVGRKLSGAAADRMLTRLRAAPGILVLDRGAGAGALVRALRGNIAVGILIDQDTTAVDSEFVEFFGLPARTPTGPARVAAGLSVPVVPLYTRRDGQGRHDVFIEAPVDPGDYGGRGGALELTRLLTARIEGWIRSDPRQWIWFHERWCRRPPGSPGLR